MTQVDEKSLHELLVRIDRTLCVGFGDCVTAAPSLFELDDEGIAVFRALADVDDRETLVNACRACPVDALTVIDADGHQLAP